jgi:hypothetical protein
VTPGIPSAAHLVLEREYEDVVAVVESAGEGVSVLGHSYARTHCGRRARKPCRRADPCRVGARNACECGLPSAVGDRVGAARRQNRRDGLRSTRSTPAQRPCRRAARGPRTLVRRGTRGHDRPPTSTQSRAAGRRIVLLSISTTRPALARGTTDGPPYLSGNPRLEVVCARQGVAQRAAQGGGGRAQGRWARSGVRRSAGGEVTVGALPFMASCIV